MKPNCILFLILLLIPAFVHAQAQIGPANRRVELLESVDAVLAKQQKPESIAPTGLVSPFHGVIASKAPKKEEVIQPVVEERLPDAEALENIAPQFKPISSLVLGDRRVLNMGQGRTLPLGHTFSARVRSHSYTVVISDIDERGYLLRIGDAELRRDYSEARTGVQFSGE